MQDSFITPRQAAEQLGLQPITIYRWIKSGRIPIHRLPSGLIRIQRGEIEKLLRKVGG